MNVSANLRLSDQSLVETILHPLAWGARNHEESYKVLTILTQY